MDDPDENSENVMSIFSLKKYVKEAQIDACVRSIPYKIILDGVTHHLSANSEIRGFDLQGYEGVTDQVLIALTNLKELPGGPKSIEFLDVSGCIYITDWGIRSIAKSFTNLKKIYLKGCIQLTEVAMFRLVGNCALLEILDVRGTKAAYLPGNENLCMKNCQILLDGCPLLLDSTPPEYLDKKNPLATRFRSEPPSKLVIFDHPNLEDLEKNKVFDILHFLSTSELHWRDQDKHVCFYGHKDLLENQKFKLDLPKFNVFESALKMTNLGPFISNRTPYIIAVDISEINVQLNVTTYMNFVRGQDGKGVVIILGLCTTDDKGKEKDQLDAFERVLNDMENCFRSRKSQESIQANKPDLTNPNLKAGNDFYFQSCQARSIIAIEEFADPMYYAFSINTTNAMVKMVWPEATINDLTPEQVNEAKTAIEEWEKEWENAKIGLETLDNREITMLKAFANPPTQVISTLACVSILLNESPDWMTAKKLMMDPKFKDKLVKYDYKKVTPMQRQKLQQYLFDVPYQLVSKLSTGAGALLKWVTAVLNYKNIQGYVSKMSYNPENANINSKPSENEEIQDLKRQAEEMMSEVQEEIVKGNEAIKRLNKSDISEIKSMKMPPALLKSILECVFILLFKTKSKDWSEVKGKLLDMSFMNRIMDFDMDSVGEKEMNMLKSYMEDPHLTVEGAKRISNAGASFISWVKAIYSTHEKRRDAQKLMKTVLQKQHELQIELSNRILREHNSPKPILQCLQEICKESLNDWRLTEPVHISPLVLEVLKSVQQIGLKITDLKALYQAMSGTSYSGKTIERALQKLHLQGELFYFPDVGCGVIVVDLAWFCQVINQLQDAEKDLELRNGQRNWSLHPDVPILPKNWIESKLSIGADQIEVSLCLETLVSFGILVSSPIRCPVSYDMAVHNGSYFMFTHLPYNTYLRQNEDEAIISYSQFKQPFWPEVLQSTFLPTDACVNYIYDLTFGIPVSLIPQIISECCRLSYVVQVWSSGFVARMGSVEVKLRHAIHGTNVNSCLYLEARQTFFSEEGPDHQTIKEHIWSVMSLYMLVIEYNIARYSLLHAKHMIPCQGTCMSSGVGNLFSVNDFFPAYNYDIECSKCKGSESIEWRQQYLYAPQLMSPSHDWRDPYDHGVGGSNTGSPYAPVYGTEPGKTPPTWVCWHCGIAKQATVTIWDMQTTLYPSMVGDGLQEITLTENIGLEYSDVKHNIVSTSSSQPTRLFVTKHVLYLKGMRTVDLEILQIGSINLIIANEDSFAKKDFSKGKFKAAQLCYSLESGSLNMMHCYSPSGKSLSSCEISVCEIGDILTIEAVDNILIDTDTSDEQHMMLLVHFKKNGVPFLEVCVQYRSFLGIYMQEKDSRHSEALLRCRDSPVVMAEHFPLGSSLLYKTGLGNQITLGKVTRIVNGRICVEPLSENRNQKAADLKEIPTHNVFSPSAQDIMPVLLYSDLAIVIENEVMKSSEQLVKYIQANKSYPAPIGLFESFGKKKAQYSYFNFRKNIPRFCTAHHNSPAVLEQIYLTQMVAEKGAVKGKVLPFIFVPTEVDDVLLLNPYRKTLQNWSQQNALPVCMGNIWGSADLLERDMHLLQLTEEDYAESGTDGAVSFSTKKIIADLQNRYYSLSLLKNLGDEWKTYFPKSKMNLSKNVVQKCLAEIFWLYRQTYMLLEIVDMNLKHRRSEKMKDSQHYFGYSSGRCSLHESNQKKNFFKKENDFNNLGSYCNYVTHLTVSHLSLDQQFSNIITAFPNLESLSLSSCGLKNIDGISSLVQLKRLIVPGNRLSEVAQELNKLTKTLIHLDVSRNPITLLPPFISSFENLQLLSLGNTMIAHLPEDIGNLTNLRTLDLKVTLIDTLPHSFKRLRRIEELSLDGVPWPNKDSFENIMLESHWNSWIKNSYPFDILTEDEKQEMFHEHDQLKDGTLTEEEIGKLAESIQLKFPRIGRNNPDDKKYGGIPSQIFQLRNLRVLALRHQALQFIPKELSNLRKLRKVFLHHNPLLEYVDEQVGSCQSLSVIDLHHCPKLHTPPPEIITQGNRVVLAYLKRLAQGSVECNRTKLMFVGLGGAGKTSLMRALMSDDHKAPHLSAEAITDGIDISTWTIKQAEHSLQYSVWDFAGQTVYYNTHQFFLTKRAIYILVWNTRLGFEHAGLEFWLSSIACHCPDAPIFVVGTHADQITRPELPEEELKRKHPNISFFFIVSSIKGMGIKELRNQLIDVTMSQPYMGSMIPETWLNLENAILSRRSKQSLLSWTDVDKLATSSGIYGTEIKQAVHFLDDLGSLKYFDNELLKDRIVINPQWIVDVMACVVSVHNKVIEQGRFQHKDVGRIWRDYPKELHQWMLRLTEVFDLTFPLSEEPVNIVPCLLPQKEPQYEWLPESPDIKETKMVYKFEYLPAGLFNRVQVRLYEFSEGSNMWKTGSVLKKNGHMAVIKQTDDTTMFVRVQGVRPENIQLLIHEVIESLIADFFQGVRYEYMLPCSDCIKVKTEDPTMFSSKILRKAIEMKALFLQCHTFFHTLAIQDIQNSMPPISSSDYSLQIQNVVRELEDLDQDLSHDLFFLFNESNIPHEKDKERLVSPLAIKNELEKQGFSSFFTEELSSLTIADIAVSMKKSKIVLVLVSNEFVESDFCQRMFSFAKETLKKDLQLLMVGEGREWLQSEFVGIQTTEQVFVNFQRINQFSDKIKELAGTLKQKLSSKASGSMTQSFDVFVSYAWVNSASAINAKQAREKEGALGAGDPRMLKQLLESNGISCWLDIEQVGRTGLFEDIAVGMKQSQVVIACVSDEYALSENCQMEFRFAHVALKKPIILAVVGTGYFWESTEIGMLSLGYPKINFQAANTLAQDTLIQFVKEALDNIKENSIEEEKAKTQAPLPKEQAFQELYEMAQRKFLRQLSTFTDQLEPFPRLFVADLNIPPDEIEDDDAKIVINDLKPGQFCIKILCEHEKGWHCVDDGFPVEVGGQDLVHLWKMTAPYMARLIAIIKHRVINLHIINSTIGKKIVDFLDMKSGADLNADIKPIYLELRRYLMHKDINHSFGGLKRCYLPNGKTLWLCSEHQKLPRISLLEEQELENSYHSEVDILEVSLLNNLRSLTKAIKDENKNGEGRARLTMRKASSNVKKLTSITKHVEVSANSQGKDVDEHNAEGADGDPPTMHKGRQKEVKTVSNEKTPKRTIVTSPSPPLKLDPRERREISKKQTGSLMAGQSHSQACNIL